MEMKQKSKTNSKIRIIGIAVLVIVAALIAVIAFNRKGKENNDGAETEIRFSDDNYLYQPGKSHIKTDKDTGVEYFNDCIQIMTDRILTQEEETHIASLVKGEIAGRITGACIYQIKIQPADFDEIDNLTRELVKTEPIIFASYCGPEEIEFDENDAEARVTSGLWWVDAINMPEAHEKGSKERNINVGIIDCCFDLSYEDLNLDPINGPHNDETANTHDEDFPVHHGTFCASLFASKDNDIGITGVYSDAELNCISVAGLFDQTFSMIDVLLHYEDCKIINLSYRSKKDTIQYILFMERELAEKDRDFLIVQAAGNNGENLDEDPNPGIFTGIEAYDVNLVNDALTKDGGKIEKGCYLSERKAFTEESLKNITDHIIVVGAAKNEETSDSSETSRKYYASDFSNYGRTVDIFAPGENITSCGYGGIYGANNGTSYSTPIVSGAAAYIWSLRPELSAKDIKTILTTSTNQYAVGVKEDAGNLYPFLDLNAAVTKTLGYVESPLKEGFGDSSVIDEFHDRDDNIKNLDSSSKWIYYSLNSKEYNEKSDQVYDVAQLELGNDWSHWSKIGLREGDAEDDHIYLLLKNDGSVLVWCEQGVFAGYANNANAAGFRISADGKIEYGSFAGLTQADMLYGFDGTKWSDSIEQCSIIESQKYYDLISDIKKMPSIDKVEQIVDLDILEKDIYIMKYGTVDGYEDYLNPPEGTFKIRAVVDGIRIRSTPSAPKDNSNKVGDAKKGDEFIVYETTNNEGYTWYRIGNDQWIADDGTWTERID